MFSAYGAANKMGKHCYAEQLINLHKSRQDPHVHFKKIKSFASPTHNAVEINLIKTSKQYLSKHRNS